MKSIYLTFVADLLKFMIAFLASHWPCGTEFSGLSTYGLNGHGKGDEHPTYGPYWGMGHFFYFFSAKLENNKARLWLKFFAVNQIYDYQ